MTTAFANRSSSANRSFKIYFVQPGECFLAEQNDDFLERMRNALAMDRRVRETSNLWEADIVLLNQCWQSRNWHDIEVISKCEFVQKYSEKILTISHDDVAVVFFPGLYTSLTPRNHWDQWSRPCGYKRQYREIPDFGLSGRNKNPKWLYSFRGADFSHPIRKKLNKLYGGVSEKASFVVENTKFHSHDEHQQHIYTQELLNSHFALAPRGYSPSTYRLFEAMQLGICPVIISDDWQPIAGVDWDSCSIQIPQCNIGNLENILEDLKPRSCELGNAAQQCWQHLFSDGNREKIMLNSLIELHAICRRDRCFKSLVGFWNSKIFRRAHGWGIDQRVMHKIKTLG